MGKKFLLNINVLMSAIIIVGTICMTLANVYTYSHIIKNDIQHIATLTSSNIFSEISNDMTKPVFVSLTMANDTFLKQWMENERRGECDADAQKDLRDYLLAYKNKYGYNSVFLVSSHSSRYYHYKGLHKTISPHDAHDVWYYNFLKEKKLYSLIIDKDEADQNVLTVFVNCRVEDAQGRLLGVVGVGVKILWLQNTLSTYRKNYGIRACLVNADGVVQVHPEENIIGQANIFHELSLHDLQQTLLQKHAHWDTAWYERAGQENFIVSRYIPEMDWFLVVEHDTTILKSAFRHIILRNTVITIIILALLLSLSTLLISHWRKAMHSLATRDDLTGLPNRRAFNDALAELLDACTQAQKKERRARTEYPVPGRYAGPERRRPAAPLHIFIFDIDEFKHINDTQGHMVGDRALAVVGQTAQQVIGKAGIVARWGGDEFIGYVRGSREQCLALAQNLVTTVAATPLLPDTPGKRLTISMGITTAEPGDTVDSLAHRADSALYTAKEQGRNCLIFEK